PLVGRTGSPGTAFSLGPIPVQASTLRSRSDRRGGRKNLRSRGERVALLREPLLVPRGGKWRKSEAVSKRGRAPGRAMPRPRLETASCQGGDRRFMARVSGARSLRGEESSRCLGRPTAFPSHPARGRREVDWVLPG